MTTNAQDPADADLMTALAGGDQAALASLYTRYGGAVHALARQVTRSEFLADEISQVVFTDLWSRPGRFDPGRGSLRTWLLTQTHGRAVDAVRSEQARRHREQQDVDRPSGRPDDEVEAAAQLSLLSEAVREAVGALPPDEQAAILLTYFQGHTYRAAAERLDQPGGTVKSRIRTGLQRLRQLLRTEGVAP